MDERFLDVFRAKKLGRKTADELVDGTCECGDALLAEYCVCCLRVPNSEQLALLLEDEPVQLWIKGNHDRLPRQAGLEHGAVPIYIATAATDNIFHFFLFFAKLTLAR